MKIADSRPTARLRISSVNGDFVVAHGKINYVFYLSFRADTSSKSVTSYEIYVVSILRSNCQKYT